MLDRLSEIVFPTARTPRRWTRLPGGIGRLPSHPRYRAALETRQAGDRPTPAPSVRL